MTLILASASPRRAQLLAQLAVKFQQRAVDIDESPVAGEVPRDYVMRMAEEKAAAAWQQFGAAKTLVLAADTTVVADQRILGKPADEDDFRQMMQLLSGREHQVFTAVVATDGERCEQALSDTRVQFAHLSEADINWYWSTGEPRDKAGGYGIQGLGARFIPAISGSYTGVVGLPLYETTEILRNFGILAGSD